MQTFSHNMKWGGVRSILIKLLGCFLLVTAGLKIHGLLTDPYGQENFLALPWLQVLTIEIEVLLGLWLLSGLASHIAWWITLVFFTILAVFSFTLAYQGQASCGCFGKVEVNPWYTFALDVGIAVTMLVLSFISPPIASRAASAPGGTTQHLQPLFQITLLTMLLLGIIALGFTIFTGDPFATLAKLRGETLSVNPPITRLGEGTVGESRTFPISLRNYSDKPIRVVGGTTSCACIASQDLPITIRAGGTETIRVKIKFSGSPGKFAHRFVLYSDSDERLTIARFSGAVTKATEKAKGVTESTRQPAPHREELELAINQGVVR